MEMILKYICEMYVLQIYNKIVENQDLFKDKDF